MVFLGPDALDAGGGSSEPAPVEVVGYFLDRLKPFIVLVENKLGLSDLVADSQPPISNVIVCPKQLNPFPAQAESLDDVIHFTRLRQRAYFWLLSYYHVDVDVRVDEVAVEGFL